MYPGGRKAHAPWCTGPDDLYKRKRPFAKLKNAENRRFRLFLRDPVVIGDLFVMQMMSEKLRRVLSGQIICHAETRHEKNFSAAQWINIHRPR